MLTWGSPQLKLWTNVCNPVMHVPIAERLEGAADMGLCVANPLGAQRASMQ